MSRPNTPALPHRQPVQIALDSDNGSLVTLCNDGTIWTIIMGLPEAGWEQLPPIPQPEMPAAPVEEQTYPEPDQKTCPVRCVGVWRYEESGEIHAYRFVDVAGNERNIAPRHMTNRHELIGLFGGTDTWLRANFPKKATVTISNSGTLYTDEAVVDFRLSDAGEWLKNQCVNADLADKPKAGEP